MVGESFHPRGCWGEDSDHIRLGATVQKLLRLFAFMFAPLRANRLPQSVKGNARVAGAIEAIEGDSKIIFQKVLDRIAGPTLYKEGCVIM
jgi:hypothetical protein